MRVTWLVRIAAAIAVAITVIGVLAGSKAEADGFTGVRTYLLWHGGLRLLNSYNCVPDTHLYPDNPIDVVQNKCPTRVWLHENENNTGLTYCVSPYTSGNFEFRFMVGNLQVSSNSRPC